MTLSCHTSFGVTSRLLVSLQSQVLIHVKSCCSTRWQPLRGWRPQCSDALLFVVNQDMGAASKLDGAFAPRPRNRCLKNGPCPVSSNQQGRVVRHSPDGVQFRELAGVHGSITSQSANA